MSSLSSIPATAPILVPVGSIAQTSETPMVEMATRPAETGPAAASNVWLMTLQTETPQQGLDLALTLARRAVRTTQPDTDVLKAQRPVHAADASSLIGVLAAAAAWPAPMVAVNDCWRE